MYVRNFTIIDSSHLFIKFDISKGIDIIRKKPEVVGPHREIPPPRKERKISSTVPAVPKCDVDKLLNLSSSKQQPMLPPVDAVASLPSSGIHIIICWQLV